ncbi:MAG: dihydrodipicolinate synthase family protein [Clostridia bacterium]|jgi:4-hydroxy-tetrahydrodipicolinate synthase
MADKFPNGVWPTMLTPFTDDNKVDYDALEKLVDWYISQGVHGLFAVCQSSEMFFLSLEERVGVARFVKEKANGRIPVIASGHISDSLEDQAHELNRIAQTGVDAVILLTNRLAKQDEGDDIWLENLKRLLDKLPEDLPLGFYECPYPYKRIISPELLKWCADTGRFYFLKDTSCDVENMRAKLHAIKGTQLKLFNANTASLLDTLQLGAHGFSGVMANFQSDLYVWLTENFHKKPEKARKLNDFLTICALIERQVYPVNAKYYLASIGVLNSIQTRTKNPAELNEVAKSEVAQLIRLTELFRETIVA